MQGPAGHALATPHPSGQQRNEENPVYAVTLQHNGSRYIGEGGGDYYDSRGMPPPQQIMHQTLSPNERSMAYFKGHPGPGGPAVGGYYNGGGIPPGEIGWSLSLHQPKEIISSVGCSKGSGPNESPIRTEKNPQVTII